MHVRAQLLSLRQCAPPRRRIVILDCTKTIINESMDDIWRMLLAAVGKTAEGAAVDADYRSGKTHAPIRLRADVTGARGRAQFPCRCDGSSGASPVPVQMWQVSPIRLHTFT